MKAIEKTWVLRHMERPVVPSQNEHPPYHSERTSLGPLESVEGCPTQQHRHSHHHCPRRDAIAPPSPHIVLHIHQHYHRKQRPYADAEVESVEEEYHPLLLLWVFYVKLVRPKPRHIGLDSPTAHGDGVQGGVKEGQLFSGGRDALVVLPPDGAAWRRPHGGDGGGHSE